MPSKQMSILPITVLRPIFLTYKGNLYREEQCVCYVVFFLTHISSPLLSLEDEKYRSYRASMDLIPIPVGISMIFGLICSPLVPSIQVN